MLLSVSSILSSPLVNIKNIQIINLINQVIDFTSCRKFRMPYLGKATDSTAALASPTTVYDFLLFNYCVIQWGVFIKFAKAAAGKCPKFS